MSDFASFRSFARTITERAHAEQRADRFTPEQASAVERAADGLLRITSAFDAQIDHVTSTYRPERLPDLAETAAREARAAIAPYEAQRDAAVSDARDYALHALRLERDGPGRYSDRPVPPELTGLELARVQFLWSRLASDDPALTRVKFVQESAKDARERDEVFVRACSTYPVPGLIDDVTRERAGRARIKALDLETYEQALRLVASSLDMLVEGARGVIDGVAGKVPADLTRAGV